jgi:[acyl-carrier-protein] S-malonyltransferase
MLAPWIEDGESKALLIQWSDAIDLDLVHLGVHADADEIKVTANAQPLIVAAGLLSARAIDIAGKYSFVAGHSVGEITAAAIAGVITPLDAMKLVRTRGLEMAKAAAIAPAGMSAVLGGDREIVLKAIAEAGLVAANDNGGGQIVAAGDLEALARLAPDGARVRALAVAGAFHTSYMEPAVEPMRSLAATIEVSDSSIGVLSNKDGAVLTSGREILNRIVNQIANPVRWDLCLQTLGNQGVTGAIEVAPAGTLVGLIKRAIATIEQCALKSPAEIELANTFATTHSRNQARGN